MSSSSKHGFRNVPPPQGSKPASAYTRFIPREELGDFAAWKPGSFHGEPEPEMPAEPAAPPEPTPEEWQAKIAAARQAGYQDGYRDGLVALEGFKQSFAAQATSQVGAVVNSFNAQLDRLDAEIAEAVARTAVQLARQVLRSELRVDPSLVARVAAEAVNNVLLSARHITVRVHPNDLPLVSEGAEEALTARGARLLADESIERGGVLVDSEVGSLDARIASRWAQAASVLGSSVPWEPTP
jgi:flagellar assembly protein FliH